MVWAKKLGRQHDADKTLTLKIKITQRSFWLCDQYLFSLLPMAFAACLSVFPSTDAKANAQEPAGTDTLTFGIVPQQSASRLASMWGPLFETFVGGYGGQHSICHNKGYSNVRGLPDSRCL